MEFVVGDHGDAQGWLELMERSRVYMGKRRLFHEEVSASISEQEVVVFSKIKTRGRGDNSSAGTSLPVKDGRM
ncbi:hypothetical protein Tco_0322929 [Tanacetum coccineum]